MGSGVSGRRIALVISSLGCGGAEKVLTLLANAWAARGDRVAVLTLDDAPPFRPLAAGVAHVRLGLAGPAGNRWQALRRNLGRIRALRRGLAGFRPDAVVSFLTSTNVLSVLAAPRGVPVVVSERADPRFQGIGRAWASLRRVTYPHAAAFVAQTRGALDWFPKPVRRIGHVVPNPVPDACRASPRPENPGRRSRRDVVAIGRLEFAKGFDLLLQAFATVAGWHPEWSLSIWGDGPARGALKAQRARLGLEDRVRLPGRTRDVAAVLEAADLFVLSSRTEGFPNVLCEAMAHGLAVVATACGDGPSMIVRDGYDGLLVPCDSAAGLGSGLDRLMREAALRRRLGKRACEVSERFSVERVLHEWDRVLEAACDA